MALDFKRGALSFATWEFPKIGDPKIVVIRTPKINKVPLIFGNSHFRV